MYGKVILLIAAFAVCIQADGHAEPDGEDPVMKCYSDLQECTDNFNMLPHDDWYSYSDYYTCLESVQCWMDNNAEMVKQSMLMEIGKIRDNWGQQWESDGASYLTISVVSLMACLLFIFFGQ